MGLEVRFEFHLQLSVWPQASHFSTLGLGALYKIREWALWFYELG